MFRSVPICLVFLSMLLASIPGTARAQGGTVGRQLATCVLRDAPGLTATALFRAPQRFDCTTPQRTFGAGDFWVISAPLKVDTSRPPRTVRSASVWQERMTLYAQFADGAVVALPTDQHSATRHLQLGAIVQRWLPRRPAPLVRLLWHVEGAANLRGIVLAPAIASGAEAAGSNTLMAAVYAAFAGVCVALLLYNLGLARALPHAFLPFYCLMMVGMLLYAFSSSGALAWALPDLPNNARLRINYLLLASTGIAATFFLRHFFERHVVPRWLDRLILAACTAVALPAIAVALVAPWQLRVLDMAYAIGFAILVSMAIPMIACAWAKRSQFLWLFIIAWTAPIVLATLRIAQGLNWTGYSFWLDNSTIVSMGFEALLSSLAIAYRILLITRERDAARAQEIAARMLADADPLTGLMNRRSFLREAIGSTGGRKDGRADDQQLLLIDIDNFKRVNDTLGHDGGDEVLRLVARVLREGAGAQSLVARIGGEEFAIVTPVSDALDADTILATLRAARMPFDLTVTASIGACSGPLTRESEWKALYCAADQALYDAKHAGRDRHRGAELRALAA